MSNGSFRKLILKLVNKNYRLAECYYCYNLKIKDQKYCRSPLLVYQMGKVGSSSITKTLFEANIGRSIYHIHFLEPRLIDFYERKRSKNFSTTSEKGLKHIWQYGYIAKNLHNWAKNETIKIISLVREPIARNISDFFENIEIVKSDLNGRLLVKSNEYDFEVCIDQSKIEYLAAIFLKKFPHEDCLNYYHREFNGVLKIDIYKHKFNTTKGFTIFKEREYEILIIRLENLNLCFNEAMKDFLDIDNLVLVNENLSINKEYDGIYQRFKSFIKFPETFIDKIYSSKFSRHFYTYEERQQFKKRWMEVT